MMKRQLNPSIAQKIVRVKTDLRISAVLMMVFFVTVSGTSLLRLAQVTHAAAAQRPAGIQVTISASDATISWDERESDRERFELPVLYLHRQRETTPAAERTLEIGLVGLAAGNEIEIKVVSFHEDVTTGRPVTARMSFLSDRRCTANAPCTVDWTIDAANLTGRKDLSGFYSDLYYVHVTDTAGQTLWEDLTRPAFAALDTWDMEMDGYAVRVTYAALFPFARGQRDLDNRLPPDKVPNFIELEFVPIIRETWRTQVNKWGFGQPLHPDWDADKVIEIVVTDLPFALFDGTGTYTLFHGDDGRFTSTRRIWWFSSNNSFQAYDSLDEAYRASFPHEFFHLMQWNVLLNSGRQENYWQSWLEGQATVAPTVQYPELAHSTYNSSANRVLAAGLKSSYRDLETNPSQWYDGALYWRFLYEAYGDLAIFRVALEEMARYAGADDDDGSAVVAMKAALDATFARLDGPFRSFDDSLIAFARANYALRLSNGRCAAVELSLCGGLYYDPQDAYAEPPVETELAYDGSRLSYDGAIGSSYGTDFIEVNVDLAVHNQPLTIKLQSEGGAARFNVQLWVLGPGIGKPRAVTPQPDLVPLDGSGAHVHVNPRVDWRATNRVALIITRLDSDEMIDPVGNYQVTLESGSGDLGVAATD